MLRLVLGLVLACALLYGAYRGLRPDAPASPAQQAAARREGLPLPDASLRTPKTVLDEARKIEAANRAALDRTVNSAEGR
jgi:hypothetical protein